MSTTATIDPREARVAAPSFGERLRNDPAYQLSVNSGTPSGMNYTPGQSVTVTAAGAPSGQAFAFWTGDTGVLANATSFVTTATLSQPYVSLRAIYNLNTAPSGGPRRRACRRRGCPSRRRGLP